MQVYYEVRVLSEIAQTTLTNVNFDWCGVTVSVASPICCPHACLWLCLGEPLQSDYVEGKATQVGPMSEDKVDDKGKAALLRDKQPD